MMLDNFSFDWAFDWGSFHSGLSMPGRQLNEADAFQASQILRECSVRRFISSKPSSTAKRRAPSPTIMTWLVRSITVFARRETFLMRRTDATEPARWVGPCITLASSSTSPCSLGRPPYPTESSLGSSSTMVTAATTASSVSPPFLRMSMPRPSAFTPLALEMISGRLPCAAGAAARASLLTLGVRPLAAAAGVVRSNKLAMPAAALPASEVRKNLRRDHKLIAPPFLRARQYTTTQHRNWKFEIRSFEHSHTNLNYGNMDLKEVLTRRARLWASGASGSNRDGPTTFARPARYWPTLHR